MNDYNDYNASLYDGLPPDDWDPPSKEQEELDFRAGFIGGQFRSIASRPWDPWDIIGHFGLSLLRLARERRPERLSAIGRDRLLNDLETGRQALFESLDGSVEEREMLEAMDGAFMIANHLAESDEQRAARHPDVMCDAFDRLQIAVNTARSHCLREDLARRADRRITEEVGALVALSLQATGLLTADQVANRSRRHG
ncbi:hypothetical protein [Bosea sp. (in: a-proteobacteria)]|uniref:hypothetical protein n=1 Tax=Bosea sp. (in: a-proteobacteria) TaxID=1871050 RepID=UPI0026326D5A|nr:hypothetical protein [Bosea sp. (in: a-proteobacteria)]MCO5089880.1 hypothetical protein [Bosea sp. (in: a-proteobacteria)]